MGQTRSRLGRKRRGVISFRLSVVSQAAASLADWHRLPFGIQSNSFATERRTSRRRRRRPSHPTYFLIVAQENRSQRCVTRNHSASSFSYLCQCTRAVPPVALSAKHCPSNSYSCASYNNCRSNNRASNKGTKRSVARGLSAPRNRPGRRSSTGLACCTPSTRYQLRFAPVTYLSEYLPPPVCLLSLYQASCRFPISILQLDFLFISATFQRFPFPSLINRFVALINREKRLPNLFCALL